MIKTISLLLLIIALAWLSQDYFSTDLPKEKHDNIFSKNQGTKIKQTDHVESKITIETLTSHNIIDRLAMLLKENKFYDALSLYLENNTAQNMKMIERYLSILAKSNLQLALEYMQVFLDNEPQSSVRKLIVTTYIAQEDYAKAISMLMQMKENYISENEDKHLYMQLRDTAIQYIDLLMKRKEYATLITFLEEMIAYDNSDNFYTYRLAKLYMHLDKTQEATPLLEELKYDDVYAQNVKTLLNDIDNNEKEAYEYAIPLLRYGDHYVVNVFLDGISFSLMLDTGATFIFIDENKASNLEVIRDDLVLETAGNNIHAKLCNASSMKIGNLELSNIHITTAAFKRDGIDGLLGMNFFKQFRFFINQDEDILYLNPK